MQDYAQYLVPLDRAVTLANLASAKVDLAGTADDLATILQALPQLAEAVLRDGGHLPFADYYVARASEAQAIIDTLSKSVRSE